MLYYDFLVCHQVLFNFEFLEIRNKKIVLSINGTYNKPRYGVVKKF